MKFKKHSLSRRTKCFCLLIGAVFLGMLLFNCLTPYVADDYTFAFSFATGERLTGIRDTFASQQAHYFSWSGRFLIKFLAQLFTVLPKMVFNLLNALVFTLFGLVICQIASGRRVLRSPLLLLFIYLGLWQFSPVFGQTNLWMCGSFNYLWASFFCFAALLPFALYSDRPFPAPLWLAAGTFLSGLAAGWSSENTSAGLLAGLVLLIIFELIQTRRAPLWMWTGLIGSLVGFALLILAPGNYLRHDTAPDPRGPLTILAVRFLSATQMLWEHGLVLLAVFAVLYTLLVLQKPGARALFLPIALLTAGLCANYAMILSPVYYERSTHGVLSFLLLACAACAARLNRSALRPAAVCAAAVLGLVTAFQLIWAGYDIASFAAMRHLRDDLVRQQSGQQAELVSYAVEPYTRWCAGYGLPDLQENPEHWFSKDFGRYYGFESVTASEARTYPFPGKTNTAFESGKIPS